MVFKLFCVLTQSPPSGYLYKAVHPNCLSWCLNCFVVSRRDEFILWLFVRGSTSKLPLVVFKLFCGVTQRLLPLDISEEKYVIL